MYIHQTSTKLLFSAEQHFRAMAPKQKRRRLSDGSLGCKRRRTSQNALKASQVSCTRYSSVPARTQDMIDDNIFIAEAVIGDRVNKKGQFEYLVKWEGYPMKESIWEPCINISDDLFADWILNKMDLDEIERQPGEEDTLFQDRATERARSYYVALSAEARKAFARMVEIYHDDNDLTWWEQGCY